MTQAGDSHLQVEISQSLPMPLHGSFSCSSGQMLALVGPSGAGKTSMLRMLAGLLQPAQARVSVGDEIWCDTSCGVHMRTQQRRVGFVFQNYALMPHMTAIENVALAMLHLPRKIRIKLWISIIRLLLLKYLHFRFVV